MKRILAALTIIAATAAPLFAGNDQFALPEGFSISLPANGSVQTEWLAPPLPVSEVRTADFAIRRFRLDRHNEPWILHNSRVITNLNNGVAFTLTRDVNDFIWLNDGALLLAGEKTLAVIPPMKMAQGTPAKLPELPLQPVIPLPAAGFRLATDGKDAIFAYGYTKELGGHAVFSLRKGFAGWQREFITGVQIADVCFDGARLSIAAGRTIHRLKPGEQSSLSGVNHPLENFTGLACNSDGSLFFSTAKGVGMVNGAVIEFIKSDVTQIEARDQSLYLFMAQSLGIMRINNTRDLFTPAKK